MAEATLSAILEMRDEYRREMACQIVHDSWHARGFTRSYLLRADGEVVGYGSLGGSHGEARDIVKEFYVRPRFRSDALALFDRLLIVSGARTIEAQTNDVLLMSMLWDFALEVSSEKILFADGLTTTLGSPETVLRRLTAEDQARAFPHSLEPVGDWGLELKQQLVATGGLFFHYNPPYGDIYMEVAQEHHRKGLGSYLVQELKRICYETGHIPAARCDKNNLASRLTLERAGMFPCARILRGVLRDVA